MDEEQRAEQRAEQREDEQLWLRYEPFTAAEARTHTNMIRHTAGELWRLLEEARERQAHVALGYSSWRAYIEQEFGMSEQRSYQLLDQARVVHELEAAGLDSTTVESLTERDARRLKPVLPEVTREVAARVEAGEEPGQVAADVAADARADAEARADARADARAMARRTPDEVIEGARSSPRYVAERAAMVRAAMEDPQVADQVVRDVHTRANIVRAERSVDDQREQAARQQSELHHPASDAIGTRASLEYYLVKVRQDANGARRMAEKLAGYGWPDNSRPTAARLFDLAKMAIEGTEHAIRGDLDAQLRRSPSRTDMRGARAGRAAGRLATPEETRCHTTSLPTFETSRNTRRRR